MQLMNKTIMKRLILWYTAHPFLECNIILD